jgi:hypothetical protein
LYRTGSKCRALPAFFTLAVKYGFKHIELKIMARKKVTFYFVKQLAVQMYQYAAVLAQKMKVAAAFCRVAYVLVTGACPAGDRVLSYLSIRRKFFKMTVYGRHPYKDAIVFKVPHDLIRGNMGAAQRAHVLQHLPPLPRVIVFRSFHKQNINRAARQCQYENESCFHIAGKKIRLRDAVLKPPATKTLGATFHNRVSLLS